MSDPDWKAMIEPAAAQRLGDVPTAVVAGISQAISLKRIADMMFILLAAQQLLPMVKTDVAKSDVTGTGTAEGTDNTNTGG